MQRLLGIDVGNSRVKIFEIRTPDGVAAAVDVCRVSRIERTAAAVLADVRGRTESFSAIHVVSVDRRLSDPVVVALRTGHSRVFHWGHERPIPLRHPYPDGTRPGDDRLVAALGARRLVGDQAAIIIDSGTALTVDVIDGTGAFLGGAISPGLAMTARALGRDAAQLFTVRDFDQSIYPARTTKDALQTGVLASWTGALRELAARARTTVPNAPILTTGGDGERAARILENLGARFEAKLLALGIRTLDESAATDA